MSVNVTVIVHMQTAKDFQFQVIHHLTGQARTRTRTRINITEKCI